MEFKLEINKEDYLGHRTVTMSGLNELQLFEYIAHWISLSTKKSNQCRFFKIVIEEDK